MHYNYAKLLLDRGERDGYTPADIADALVHFHEAATLLPGWASPEVGIGVALCAQQAHGRGAAISSGPCRWTLITSTRCVLWERCGPSEGKPRDRASSLKRLSPNALEQPEVHYALGRVLAEQGELQAAAAELAEAVRIAPRLRGRLEQCCRGLRSVGPNRSRRRVFSPGGATRARFAGGGRQFVQSARLAAASSRQIGAIRVSSPLTSGP